jgi:hypothetical protein
MEMVPIDSDGVRAIGYDPATQTMHVEFETGALFEYYEVPPDVYQTFMASSAKGSFVSQVLEPGYRSVRLT